MPMVYTTLLHKSDMFEFEGIENVSDLANYIDDDINSIADRNCKHTPKPQCILMGIILHKEFESRMCEGGQFELSQ